MVTAVIEDVGGGVYVAKTLIKATLIRIESAGVNIPTSCLFDHEVKICFPIIFKKASCAFIYRNERIDVCKRSIPRLFHINYTIVVWVHKWSQPFVFVLRLLKERLENAGSDTSYIFRCVELFIIRDISCLNEYLANVPNIRRHIRVEI